MSESIIPRAKAPEELNFVRRQLDALKSQRVKLQDDYAPPESKRARRAPIATIPLCPPPAVENAEETSGPGDDGAPSTISLSVVSTKPPLSFSLSAEPTASIGTLKAKLASEPDAPPADAQRWLLGGKAMVDAKLLREYEGLIEQAKGGATVKINLFVKAGWTSAGATAATTAPSGSGSGATTPTTPTSAGGSRTPKIAIRAATGDFMAVPGLAFEPSTPTNEEGPSSRPAPGLVIDTSSGPVHTEPRSQPAAFVEAIANPSFWLDTHAMLVEKLGDGEDSRRVFEAWFGVSKVWLTPSQIAAARERVGVTGMAGL